MPQAHKQIALTHRFAQRKYTYIVLCISDSLAEFIIIGSKHEAVFQVLWRRSLLADDQINLYSIIHDYALKNCIFHFSAIKVWMRQ